MTRPLHLFALPALALSAQLASSVPAAAQPPPAAPASPPAASDPALVTGQYEEGLKAAKENRWPQAREAFLIAWRLKPHYQIAANLGRAELMVGAYRDAAEHLAYFLREVPPEVSAEDRAQAQRWLDEAKAKIATLTLKVEPSDAEVVVYGAPLAAPLPSEVYVDPGKRVVEARRPGHETERRELELSAGQAQEVALRLDAEPPPAPQRPSPEPASPLRPVLIGVGLGVTAAMATAGASLMVMGAVKAGEQRELCPDSKPNGCKADTQETWSSLEGSRIDALNLGIASFIGAALFGGATAAYALVGGEHADGARAARVRVRVHVAPGGAGLSGHF